MIKYFYRIFNSSLTVLLKSILQYANRKILQLLSAHLLNGKAFFRWQPDMTQSLNVISVSWINALLLSRHLNGSSHQLWLRTSLNGIRKVVLLLQQRRYRQGDTGLRTPYTTLCQWSANLVVYLHKFTCNQHATTTDQMPWSVDHGVFPTCKLVQLKTVWLFTQGSSYVIIAI